jgi:hypothetical protein
MRRNLQRFVVISACADISTNKIRETSSMMGGDDRIIFH